MYKLESTRIYFTFNNFKPDVNKNKYIKVSCICVILHLKLTVGFCKGV